MKEYTTPKQIEEWADGIRARFPMCSVTQLYWAEKEVYAIGVLYRKHLQTIALDPYSSVKINQKKLEDHCDNIISNMVKG